MPESIIGNGYPFDQEMDISDLGGVKFFFHPFV